MIRRAHPGDAQVSDSLFFMLFSANNKDLARKEKSIFDQEAKSRNKNQTVTWPDKLHDTNDSELIQYVVSIDYES